MIPLCHAVHADLTRQFQRRAIQKRYEAVVYGIVEHDEGEVDLPLARDWFNKPLQKVCAVEGKHAFTRYRVIERNVEKNCTRVALHPITGRSHQLRIHMAEIGHPILGCDLYAHDETFHMAKRLMLHAHELKFTHPMTGAAVHGVSPVPF
jgi:tRNA pseudouridine32 synthase / 23S rRNA pseudouridine746 synthase